MGFSVPRDTLVAQNVMHLLLEDSDRLIDFASQLVCAGRSPASELRCPMPVSQLARGLTLLDKMCIANGAKAVAGLFAELSKLE